MRVVLALEVDGPHPLVQVVQEEEGLGGQRVPLVAEEGDGAPDVLREVLLAPVLNDRVAAALG